MYKEELKAVQKGKILVNGLENILVVAFLPLSYTPTSRPSGSLSLPAFVVLGIIMARKCNLFFLVL
jgi:hypothetical protein